VKEFLSNKKPSAMRLLPKLLSVNKTLRTLLRGKLAEIGLHPGQDELLLALSPEETVSISELANMIGVRPATISKMVDRIAAARLVRRVPHLADSRRTDVELTSPGVQMQGRIREVWQWVENEFQGMEDRERVEPDLERLEKIMATLLRTRR
jgi:DNA-binding MarR family transcriptional regulator